MLVLRSLVSIAVLPGLVTVLVPFAILRLAPLAPEGWRGLGGTLAPWDPPKGLVAAGPYRVVRNPMYVAVACVLAGEAILFASPAVAVWCALTVARSTPSSSSTKSRAWSGRSATPTARIARASRAGCRAAAS